jgi:error-prone DNA polymerase
LQLLSGHRYQSRWQLQDSLSDLPLFATVEEPTAPQSAVAQSADPQSAEAYLRVDQSAPEYHGSKQLELLADQPAVAATAFSLRAPTALDDLIEDYRRLGLSLAQHPMALLRQAGRQAGLPAKIKTAAQLYSLHDKTAVQVAGLVTGRQSPGTAGGVTFVTLEDETGNVNLLVWRATAIAQKTAFLTARILWVHGMLQREGEVIHVIAGQLQSLDHLLPELQSASRNFH